MLSNVGVDLYFEGMKVEPESITVITGVNKILQAAVQIAPNKYSSQIMPGTRVHAFLRIDDQDPVLWFQGKTQNFPTENMGNTVNPAVIGIIGDFGALEELSLEYLNVYNLLSTNVESMAQINILAANGKKKVPIAPGVMEFPFLSMLAKTGSPVSGRIYGMIQEVMASKPALYNHLRRTCFLDRLMIDFHDPLEMMIKVELIKKTLMKVMSNMDLRQSNMWDVLKKLGELTFHDFVSVAPMIHTTTKIPNRVATGYFPETSIPSNAEVWDKLCNITSDDVHTQVEMIMKPKLVGMGAPACNVLWGDVDFSGFAYSPYTMITRMGIDYNLIMPMGNAGHIVSFRPYPLQTAKDVADGYAATADPKSTEPAFSKLMQSRWSEYSTNTEILFGHSTMQQAAVDPTTSTMLMNEKNNKNAATYWDGYSDFIYSFMQGSSLSVSGPFNVKPICGFPIILKSVEGKGLKGYLMGKTDHIDFKNRMAKTEYKIEFADSDLEYDFNQPKAYVSELYPCVPRPGDKLDDIFAHREGSSKYPDYLKSYKVDSIYGKVCGKSNVYEGYDESIADAESEKRYVGLYEGLAMNKMVIHEDDPVNFISDTRVTTTDWSDPAYLPTAEMVEATLTFREYSEENAKRLDFTPLFKRERFFNVADGLYALLDYCYRSAAIGQVLKSKTSITDQYYMKFLDTAGSSWLDYIMLMGRPPAGQNLLMGQYQARTNRLLSAIGTYGISKLITIPMVGEDKRNYAEGEKINGIIPPLCPIWEGNPSPDRSSLLLHYLSMKEQSIDRVQAGITVGWKLPVDSNSKGRNRFLKYSDVDTKLSPSGFQRLEFIPRPLSEKEAIALRRFVIDLFLKESEYHVRLVD